MKTLQNPGGKILENIIANQYGGKLWAINPKGRRIMNTRTFKSIETLPDAPELGIICVPVRFVESSLQELIHKGTKTVVILTAGFSETGEEGRIAENRLVELADLAGMALIGPNTMVTNSACISEGGNLMMNKTKFEKGSGNVFKDLGLDKPKERLAKAKIASLIYNIIEDRKLTQKEAGDILGINQPKVSALRNGRLSGFSMERLFAFLQALDQDIEIIVHPKKQKKAHLDLSYAPG